MKTDKRIKIAFLGGDMRLMTAVKRLAKGEHEIFVWKVPSCNDVEKITVSDTLYKTVSGSSAVILPLPSSTDGVTLNCATDNGESKPPLALIADAIDGDCIIIGGKLPKSF